MNKKTFECDTRPIGVFDSGLGGLTVLKSLIKYLPNENFIYLGDLLNLPYGNKSKKSVLKYAINCTDFLISKNVKCIVVACNTASAIAYDQIKTVSNLPIFDVITPCVNEVIKLKKKHILILGTHQTIESNIYAKSIKEINSDFNVYNIECPLFVPIVEEGLENSKISASVINHYLNDIVEKSIDQIVLGCTHYPILSNDLKSFFNNKVDILDSGNILAQKMKKHFINNKNKIQSIEYYVTDLPKHFQKNGSRFLNNNIDNVTKIKIGHDY